MPYHEFVADSLGRVVGALPQEVVAMNALTVNLHLLMLSFYRPDAARHKIIIESGAFPSDRYAMISQIQQRGFDAGKSLIEIPPRPGELTLRYEDVIEAIERNEDSVALVMLGGVNYLTGQAFDMEAITRASHRVGAYAGFDLAHAAGNLPLKLHDWDVDFAVWCNYKYLNAGPGAIGGAFVHERHSTPPYFPPASQGGKLLPRLAGWWGHDKLSRFKMPADFDPIPGAEGWQLSNPPILQLAALRASLDEFDAAGMDALRQRSLRLTGYLENLLLESGIPGLTILTPSDPARRGAQLSIKLDNFDKEDFDKLLPAGVQVDWREPGIIRAAPAPLYNNFNDCRRFVEALTEICVGQRRLQSASTSPLMN